MTRVIVAVVGLFSLAMGLTTWLDPARIGASLGIGPINPLGLNSIGADVGAFFLASAVACAVSLITGRMQWLYGAALLYGLAAAGRLVGVAVSGAGAGVVTAILVELVLAGLLALAARMRPPGLVIDSAAGARRVRPQ